MTRNFIHWLALGLAVLTIIWVVVFTFQPAFAQAAEPIIAPYTIWGDVWEIVQPIVVLLVSTVGPVLVGWISARLLAVLKVTDEKQRLEVEGKLRDAIHQAALNALKFALARGGVRAAAPSLVTGEIISEAIGYVRSKNPDALEKLGVDQSALRDIIISKVPDILGAEAKVNV
ncbi:hypothetical protein JZX87_13845 [Agrobacterium sp. Ap1]|uniref:hypothetical protein n=1 Tax=Agrobacterium sp. Ap1 TaxID=2815337 RepID=UPI001A8D5803|nr:hypothetical protein [Agrobacterium sp. Ap1]MBO0142245.1 hypothetical protein [Agrobacterium sp. Ap1]